MSVVLCRLLKQSSTSGTPLFMGLNVIRKQGHCISTELETLMYVLILTLSGGILPWRHLDIDDHRLTSVKCGDDIC